MAGMKTSFIGPELRPGLLILAAALLFSLSPLAVLAGGGAESPFLFNLVFRGGTFLGYMAFGLALFPGLAFSRAVWRAAWRGLPSWSFLGAAALHPFEFALFAAAARHLDSSLVLLIYYLFPFLLVGLAACLLRRPLPIRRRRWLGLFALALAGVALALVSQGGGLPSFTEAGWGWLGGMLLALLAAVGAAGVAFSLRWGRDFAGALPAELRRGSGGTRSPALFGAMLLVCLTSVLGCSVSLVLGWQRGESFAALSLGGWLGWGLLGGFLFSGISGGFYRMGNLLARNLSLNGLMYLCPVLGIVLLAGLGYSQLA